MQKSIVQKAESFRIEMRRKKMQQEIGERRKRFMLQRLETQEIILDKDFFKNLSLKIQNNQYSFEIIHILNENIKQLEPNKEEHMEYLGFLFNTNLLEFIFYFLENFQKLEQEKLMIVLNLIKNLSASSEQITLIFMKKNLLEIFCDILVQYGQDFDVFEKITLSICNLMTERETKRIVLQHQEFSEIFWNCQEKFIQDEKMTILFAFYFKVLIEFCDKYDMQTLMHKYQDYLVRAFKIKTDNTEYWCDILFSIFFYLQDDQKRPNRIQFLIKKCINTKLSDLFQFQETMIIQPLLRIYIYITYYDVNCINAFHNKKFQQGVVESLFSNSYKIQQNSIKILNNLFLTSEEFFHQYYTNDVIKQLLNLMTLSGDLRVKIEASQCLLVVVKQFISTDQIEEMKKFLLQSNLIDIYLINFNNFITDYQQEMLTDLIDLFLYAQQNQESLSFITELVLASKNLQYLIQLEDIPNQQIQIRLKDLREHFLDIQLIYLMNDITDNTLLIYIIKMCKQSSQYEQMFHFSKKLIILNRKITFEMVTLFDFAVNAVMKPLRKNYQKLISVLDEEKQLWKINLIEKIQIDLIREFSQKTNFVEQIHEKLLDIHSLENNFTVVFLFKIEGDFKRYQIEFSTDEVKKNNIKEAKRAYKNAFYYAKKELVPSDMLYMGLVLNYSIFLKKYQSFFKGKELLQKSHLLIVNYIELKSVYIREEQQHLIFLIESTLKDWKEEDIEKPLRKISQLKSNQKFNQRIQYSNEVVSQSFFKNIVQLLFVRFRQIQNKSYLIF